MKKLVPVLVVIPSAIQQKYQSRCGLYHHHLVAMALDHRLNGTSDCGIALIQSLPVYDGNGLCIEPLFNVTNRVLIDRAVIIQ